MLSSLTWQRIAAARRGASDLPRAAEAFKAALQTAPDWANTVAIRRALADLALAQKDYARAMANTFHPGDLAIVVPGVGGANNVRPAPVALPKCGNCIGSFPENAVIMIAVITAGPKCNNKMIWWQVRLVNGARPIGWVSKGEGVKQLLAPLTLECWNRHPPITSLACRADLMLYSGHAKTTTFSAAAWAAPPDHRPLTAARGRSQARPQRNSTNVTNLYAIRSTQYAVRNTQYALPLPGGNQP